MKMIFSIAWLVMTENWRWYTYVNWHQKEIGVLRLLSAMIVTREFF
jgi:hypothetical protein